MLNMKVKDLIAQEIDIDVYDDVCEELGIAFCGPLELTDAGMEKFGEVMEYDVKINANGLCGFPFVVVCVGGRKDWKSRLRKAKAFCTSAAGYCAADDYDRWFKEVTA